MSESALVIPVPEAEQEVGRWRRGHDPSAADGMPAHITILVPFMPPDALKPDVIEDLRFMFAATPQFEFVLTATAAFEQGVLYLAVEPAEEFVAMTRKVERRFPEFPPYGGQHEELIPHLTVAHSSDPDVLMMIKAGLAGATPIRALASEVWLMTKRESGWALEQRFPLAIPLPPPA